LIKDELEAAKRLEKILNKLEELEQIKEVSKTDLKQRETITAKAKDEKDKTLNHQSMSPEGEPYVASEEEDKKLRSMWKENSELFVKFERYGWITGKVMKISLDSQGEWLQVGRPGAKKDVSRNSSFVRPILSEDILERLGVVKVSTTTKYSSRVLCSSKTYVFLHHSPKLRIMMLENLIPIVEK